MAVIECVGDSTFVPPENTLQALLHIDLNLCRFVFLAADAYNATVSKSANCDNSVDKPENTFSSKLHIYAGISIQEFHASTAFLSRALRTR